MSDLERRIEAIEARNDRVAADKAWEVSWTRRALICAVTYICAVILLNVLGHDGSGKHAFVPVMGYLVSTFSLPPLKRAWIKYSLTGASHE
ncbi:MAG: hypothetical protein WAO98_03640 [Alphaproteobacteria bacterium]